MEIISVVLPEISDGQVFLIKQDPIFPFFMVAKDREDCFEKLAKRYGEDVAKDMEIRDSIRVLKFKEGLHGR